MLQANQRHVSLGARGGAGTRRAWWIGLLLAALVLAGCADDEGDRRFANDPRTPQPTAIRTPSPTMPAEVPPPARPEASPEALVDRRGAPDAAWWMADGAVWVVGDGEPREVVAGGALAYAPGPGGDSVAVVTAGDRAYRIDIYDREGTRTETFENVLETPAAGASPVAGGVEPSPAVTLDWSPQGNRILLGHRSGALVDVQLDGATTRLETRVPLAGLERAAWSPRGDVIAALIRDDDGLGSLALVDPSTEPARLDVIAPVGRTGDSAKSVEAFDWKPRGNGIVFIQAQRGDAGPSGGMVVAWDRATNSTQILATGGQGGPTGSVTWISVAPDGKAVAYIVTMRGGGGSSAFVGLFVRSMIDGQLYRVPVDADATVQRTWWLGDGLAWVSTVGDPAESPTARFVSIDGSGQRTVIGTIASPAGATPAASPAASPMASPVAPPVASPVASPAASPVASPVASPGATPAG